MSLAAGNDKASTHKAQRRPLEECTISIAGRRIARAGIADTFWTRFIGLLNRTSLESREGLLLDPGGSIHTLWMRFAIDIVFLDEQGEVLQIVARVKPWRWVRSPHPTRFVLELDAGESRTLGLAPGVCLQWCRREQTVQTHHPYP